MEFSLFLAAFSLVLLGIFWVFNYVLRLAFRSDVALYALLSGAVAATVFSKFLGAALLLVLIIVLLAKKVPFFRRDGGAVWFDLIFIASMGCLIAAYFPWAPVIWEDKLPGFLLKYIEGSRLFDGFMVSRFFRYYYPAVVTAILNLSLLYAAKEKSNRYSFWYRLLRNFDHRQIVLLVAGGLAAGMSYLFKWNDTAKAVLMNLFLFTTWPYVYYGFSTLVYGIRRLKVSYFLSIVILFLFVVISGPIFIFTLILVMGIGITDIWMNYNKRKIKLF